MTASILACYLLVLSGLLYAGTKAPKPPKVQQPRAELIASRRVGMAPLKVDFTLLVKDPSQLINCVSEVSWAWSWNGQERGSARGISDCDPFALPKDVPTSWTERRTLKLTLPGVWMVAACMRGMEARTVCSSTSVELR